MTEFGDIVVRDHDAGVLEIISAPERARVSLELITRRDVRGVVVQHNKLVIGTDVNKAVYWIVGWDYDTGSLELERQSWWKDGIPMITQK